MAEIETFGLIFICNLAITDFITALILCFCRYFLQIDEDGNETISLKTAFKLFPHSSYLLHLFLRHKKQPFCSHFMVFGGMLISLLLLSVALYHQFGFTLIGASLLLFTAILVALTLIDARTLYLPDLLTIPLIVVGIIFNVLSGFIAIKASIIGAIVGFGVFWSINALFRLIRKKEGMGGGDFKLLAAIGAWLGYMQLPLVIMLSSLLAVIGALITAPLIGKRINHPLPYGPYLALSAIIALFYGETILAMYLNSLQ